MNKYNKAILLSAEAKMEKHKKLYNAAQQEYENFKNEYKKHCPNPFELYILDRLEKIMKYHKFNFYEAEQDYYDMKKYLEDKEREDKE